VATINALNDGDGVIYLVTSDYNRNFYPLSENPSQKVTFLGLHVIAMLGNILTNLSE